MNDAILAVDRLGVSFFVDGSELRAVDDAAFELHEGRTLALVGESGCGKTMTALALLGLVEPPGHVSIGRLRYDRRDVATPDELRGRHVAMVFQEPMAALNPVMRIGQQLEEPLVLHRRLSSQASQRRAVELLAEVGIAAPAERLAAYPHELSGGMRQRVMIAMALASEPRVLIADEPTTALDVTIQAQIVALLRRLQRERRMAMLFITHDLTLLPAIADDVAVMYAGRIVEQRSVGAFLAGPRHPYARALLDSMPQAHRRGERLRAIPGSVPDPRRRPAGCSFSERCGRTGERCRSEQPALEHGVACFHPHT